MHAPQTLPPSELYLTRETCACAEHAAAAAAKGPDAAGTMHSQPAGERDHQPEQALQPAASSAQQHHQAAAAAHAGERHEAAHTKDAFADQPKPKQADSTAAGPPAPAGAAMLVHAAVAHIVTVSVCPSLSLLHALRGPDQVLTFPCQAVRQSTGHSLRLHNHYPSGLSAACMHESVAGTPAGEHRAPAPVPSGRAAHGGPRHAAQVSPGRAHCLRSALCQRARARSRLRLR